MLIASVLRPMLRLLGIALVASFTPALLAQVSSPAADGFDPNVSGNVWAVAVQPDGRVLIAGNFSTIQPNGATSPTAQNNIARLLPDGRHDASFAASVNGQINAMVLQPDGRIVIGGAFTAVGGATRNRVARLNADGTLDATFDPNVGGGLTPEVKTLALQPDGKLLVGGGFISVQPNGAAAPTTRNRVARFNADGSLDTTFDPRANNQVLSFAVQPDGKILIGGGFTTLQPNGAATATARNRIARLNADGSLDGSFDPNANNAVSAIEVLPNGQILIGGTFTSLRPNGAADASTAGVQRIARLNADGTISSGFIGSADGQVHALKVQADGSILVGGAFSNLGSGVRAYFGRIL
ncbi:MAG TPA: delta-60 repeat domain-containing protein, partial [Opitutus sp.]|nr:delta-60 repeat domain-containing protein [Opitutus sp.]